MGAYFVVYNFANLLGWSWLLYTAITHLSTKFHFSLAYNTIDYLRIIQTVAVLEPLHALVLHTNVMNTVMQVASRLLIVWGPHYMWQSEEIRMHFSYSVLLMAWSTAEIIRYGFYFTKEMGFNSYVMTYLRYTGFIVLYPIGVAMEVLTLYQVTLQDHRFNWILYAIMSSYIPGLYILYTHMLRQRKKILSPKKNK